MQFSEARLPAYIVDSFVIKSISSDSSLTIVDVDIKQVTLTCDNGCSGRKRLIGSKILTIYDVPVDSKPLALNVRVDRFMCCDCSKTYTVRIPHRWGTTSLTNHALRYFIEARSRGESELSLSRLIGLSVSGLRGASQSFIAKHPECIPTTQTKVIENVDRHNHAKALVFSEIRSSRSRYWVYSIDPEILLEHIILPANSILTSTFNCLSDGASVISFSSTTGVNSALAELGYRVLVNPLVMVLEFKRSMRSLKRVSMAGAGQQFRRNYAGVLLRSIEGKDVSDLESSIILNSDDVNDELRSLFLACRDFYRALPNGVDSLEKWLDSLSSVVIDHLDDEWIAALSQNAIFIQDCFSSLSASEMERFEQFYLNFQSAKLQHSGLRVIDRTRVLGN